MKKSSVLHSPRLEELKKKKRRAMRLKFLLGALALVIIIALSFFISRASKLNINDVEVSGNTVVDTQAIKDIVTNDLTGHYLWIFPKTNFLLYPKKEIENDLSVKFPRLENISIVLKNTRTLSLSVSERQPAYTWCGATPPTNNTQVECYFMDSSGYIFDQAPYFSGNVYLTFYGTDGVNNANTPTGSYFAPDIFQKLISFYQDSKNMNLNSEAFYLLDDGDIQMLLAPGGAPSSPEIIFNTSEDFDTVAENLETALATPPLQTDFQTEYSLLTYIDLRFGNKVYYKFSTGSDIPPSGK